MRRYGAPRAYVYERKHETDGSSRTWAGHLFSEKHNDCRTHDKHNRRLRYGREFQTTSETEGSEQQLRIDFSGKYRTAYRPTYSVWNILIQFLNGFSARQTTDVCRANPKSLGNDRRSNDTDPFEHVRSGSLELLLFLHDNRLSRTAFHHVHSFTLYHAR